MPSKLWAKWRGAAWLGLVFVAAPACSQILDLGSFRDYCPPLGEVGFSHTCALLESGDVKCWATTAPVSSATARPPRARRRSTSSGADV